MMIRIINKIIGNHWKVVRTCFPYKNGYGTYNRWKKTLLDSGLTEEEAAIACKELNR